MQHRISCLAKPNQIDKKGLRITAVSLFRFCGFVWISFGSTLRMLSCRLILVVFVLTFRMFRRRANPK